jgi:DNA modification methylase
MPRSQRHSSVEFAPSDEMLNLDYTPLEPLASRLGDTDWTFSERATAPKIEGIHPYPAKFIGEIPRAFIASLPIPKGTALLDPFCGSGTSMLEAQRAGIPSIGIDLNPIACLISSVKTAPLAKEFESAVAKVVLEAREIQVLAHPDIPNVDHWFKPDIQSAVGALANRIADLEFSTWQAPLRLALSSILVRVSNQESDTRYAAIDKNVGKDDVFKLFDASARKLQKALQERTWSHVPATVIEGNTLEIMPERIGQKVGLVVTSPPYPNAYEYWLYHKYRMWWLGFDPIAVKAQEIGARAHFFKKNPHTAEMFRDQMLSTFRLIDEVLVRQGFVCIVVGRSKIHGNIIDNGSSIEDVGREIGLKVIAKFERAMNQNRKSFNLSHANIKSETVLVFQKK